MISKRNTVYILLLTALVYFVIVRGLILWATYRGYILSNVLAGATMHSLSYYQHILDCLVLQSLILVIPCVGVFMSVVFAVWKGRRFIFPLVAVLFSLLLVEVAVRLLFVIGKVNIAAYRNFSFTRFPNIYIHDPGTVYRMKPLSSGPVLTADFMIQYDINELGHRDIPLSASHNASARPPLALFLGDSQTFGEGVPVGSRFSDLVRKAYPDILVQNAGVPGYGLHQMVLYYEHYGQNLHPCVIFLCLIEEDIRRARRAALSPPSYLQETRAPSVRPIDKLYYGGYARHWGAAIHNALKVSWVYTYLSVKVRVAVVSHTLAARDAKLWGEKAAGHEVIEKDALRDTARQWIGRIHKEATANDALVVVVNISSEPVAYLESVVADLGVAYCDASDGLRDAKGIRYEFDPHYNVTGHSIIGEELLSFLQHHKWLTRPCILQ